LNENGPAAATLDQPSATEPYRVSGTPSVPASQPSGPVGAAPSTAGLTAGAAQGASVVPVAARAKELPASITANPTAYRIGPQDVLDISVFKVPELTKTVQVADSGTINLPLVGEVPAKGRTAQDIERDLTKQLGAKYLQNPQVTVFVKEYNSQRVTVEGAVKKPGVYPIRGRSSLLQIIATAEGLTEVAEYDVAVFREINGKRSAAKFDIQKIREGETEDPLLQQGDTVVVGTSSLAVGYQNLLKAVPIGSFMMLL
jgi:polysaccharide export outer membrane protein